MADWSFFCTAHGKGPVDGIGGETKRVVWKAILQEHETVTNPREFYDVAKKLMGKIVYFGSPVKTSRNIPLTCSSAELAVHMP